MLAYFNPGRAYTQKRQYRGDRRKAPDGRCDYLIDCGVDQLGGISNYFIGNDRARWRTGVPNFGQVKYSSVYPGIDLFYHGSAQRSLEYDFVLTAGASPAEVEMKVSGARKISIDREGALVIGLNDGELIQPRPEVYQLVNGKRHSIRAEYLLHGRVAACPGV